MEHTELQERIRVVLVQPGEKRHGGHLTDICNHVVEGCGEGGSLRGYRQDNRQKPDAGVWGTFTKYKK